MGFFSWSEAMQIAEALDSWIGKNATLQQFHIGVLSTYVNFSEAKMEHSQV
jgi:hypothetical protein